MSEVVVFVSVALLVVLVLPSVISGAPFVPMHRTGVVEVVMVAKKYGLQRVLDIGSGDGRVVIELARSGARAVGVEVQPVLVWWSRIRVRLLGLGDLVEIRSGNMWGEKLAGYDMLVVFGVGRIVGRLVAKIREEAMPGTIVCSYGFALDGLELLEHRGALYVYKV